MKSIKEADVKNKTVLLRVDFNVPLKNGEVADDSRIRASLPTIEYLRKKEAKIILISHLGRPDGKVTDELRLLPCAKRLEKLLKQQVLYRPDCIGSDVEEAANTMHTADVLLLENLRFYPQEEANDTSFASKLANLADIYCNDAFGTAHRAHASVDAVTTFLPSYAGFLLEKEVRMLSKLAAPKKPFIIIMGGAKVSDKINVINKLMQKTDALLIGGAMAFTFLKALGNETGKSKVELDKINLARTLLKKYKKKIVLPVDITLDNKKAVSVQHILKKSAGLDIGPLTSAIYAEIIKKAKTIFWNGPVGLFEKKPFDKGTKTIALAIASSKALSIIGGGDTLAAIRQFKLENKYTHASTGGGASLEFLEGKKLPGIKALEKS